MRQLLSGLILTLASLLGVWAFLYPFFFPMHQEGVSALAHAKDAPLVFLMLLVACLLVIVASLETQQMNAKVIAVLGVLVAINGVLRLAPSFAGFSLVYFLPILCGYVFGPTFGFLLGTLSLLVSGIITGGVGPWLPYQMLAVGWLGMTSGWLPHPKRRWIEVLMLAVWGLVIGLLFGFIMNVWFWPYLLAPDSAKLYWQPGLSVGEAFSRYSLFYVVSSLWWDVPRAAGNFLLILALAGPVLRTFRRFQRRFQFQMT